MNNFRLALIASTILASCVVNAQSVTNAWNGSPSNCDTGCAQSALVGVSGNNSGSREGATVIYQGSFTGTTSFTITRHALVSVYLFLWRAVLVMQMDVLMQHLITLQRQWLMLTVHCMRGEHVF